MRTIMLCYLILFTPLFHSKSKSAEYTEAYQAWKSGDIVQAHQILTDLIENAEPQAETLHLYMKTQYVQGYYPEALNVFHSIPRTYPKYKVCGMLAVEAYVKLNKYEDAIQLAEQLKLKEAGYLSEFKEKPFKIVADQIYAIPFFTDGEIPSDFWPGIKGSINGREVNLRFDTGGDYIIMGVEAAKKYNLELQHQSKSMHAARTTKSWRSKIDTLKFFSGPAFYNVPVTIMKGLGEYVIFGTNILEPFLTTVDYPNGQFILTPRKNNSLKNQHYNMLSAEKHSLPFYLWDDHYMFAKGSLGGFTDLTLFFDSGLILLTEIDGKTRQASFSASKESLIRWGFSKKQLKRSCFLSTDYTLEVCNLKQENTLIWYDQYLKHDRNFGGVSIDGLISHSWLQNYTWTIDFDRRIFVFGSEPF